jgi:hypothetical protein
MNCSRFDKALETLRACEEDGAVGDDTNTQTIAVAKFQVFCE